MSISPLSSFTQARALATPNDKKPEQQAENIFQKALKGVDNNYALLGATTVAVPVLGSKAAIAGAIVAVGVLGVQALNRLQGQSQSLSLPANVNAILGDPNTPDYAGKWEEIQRDNDRSERGLGPNDWDVTFVEVGGNEDEEEEEEVEVKVEED